MTNNHNDNKAFFEWASTPIYVEIDAGEYVPARSGEKLSIWVNAPGVLQERFGGRRFETVKTTDAKGQAIEETKYGEVSREQEYERLRNAVAQLYGSPGQPMDVSQIDDTTLLWLFNRGWDAYTQYHAELRANLANASLPA